MTWNYRFVKIKNEHPLDEDDEYIYQLCEVYHNEAGEPYGYCDAGPVYVEFPEDRFEVACWIAMAAAKDILDSEDINAKPDWDDEEMEVISLDNLMKELEDENDTD